MRRSFATITESPGAKSEERVYQDTLDAECTRALEGEQMMAATWLLGICTHMTFSNCTAFKSSIYYLCIYGVNIIQMSAWINAHLSFNPSTIVVLHNSRVTLISANVKAKCCMENTIVTPICCFHWYGLLWLSLTLLNWSDLGQFSCLQELFAVPLPLSGMCCMFFRALILWLASVNFLLPYSGMHCVRCSFKPSSSRLPWFEI